MNQNSCGPKWMENHAVTRWMLWALRNLFLGWFFEASCAKHDVGYKLGGDEIRRFKCDWKFWLAMKSDVRRLPIFARPFAYVVAMFMFAAVRIGGKFSFNYV